MEKFKNFIYDKNDIFIAVIIICIAALVIVNRVGAIMAYPSALSASANTSVQEPSDEKPTDTPASPSKGETPPGNTNNSSDQKPSDDTKATQKKPSDNPTKKGAAPVVNYSIYVEPGSTGTQIADSLLKVKLIDTKDEFVTAVNSAGVASKLKAGTFIIPSNATLEQTIAILIK
ncbi:MAG: hypothetical protein RR131_05420 [Anaerovorax sp.]